MKYKIGDRVNVYWDAYTVRAATIVGIGTKDEIEVAYGGGSQPESQLVHSKQCRKLRPRKEIHGHYWLDRKRRMEWRT